MWILSIIISECHICIIRVRNIIRRRRLLRLHTAISSIVRRLIKRRQICWGICFIIKLGCTCSHSSCIVWWMVESRRKLPQHIHCTFHLGTLGTGRIHENVCLISLIDVTWRIYHWNSFGFRINIQLKNICKFSFLLEHLELNRTLYDLLHVCISIDCDIRFFTLLVFCFWIIKDRVFIYYDYIIFRHFNRNIRFQVESWCLYFFDYIFKRR
jgi:hypothetical protein